MFDHLVRMVHVSADRVDPHRQQATGRDPAQRGGHERVRRRAVTMLEHLDTDHQRIGRAAWQRGQVPDNEAVPAGRQPLGELGDRGGRDVQPYQVQPGIHQRHIVAAVAAADVQAGPDRGVLGRHHDVVHERHRRLTLVPPGGVLHVPRSSRLTIHAGPSTARCCI